MEFRRHKTSCWTIPVAKVFLLQSMAMSISHAMQPTDIAATNIANTKLLALLDLSSDNSANLSGLDLYLDVTLNGANVGLAHFTYREGQLWANTRTLQELGFVLPAGIIDPVRLNSLAGVKVNYDARQQTVSIIAPLSMLNLTTTVLNNTDRLLPRIARRIIKLQSLRHTNREPYHELECL